MRKFNHVGKSYSQKEMYKRLVSNAKCDSTIFEDNHIDSTLSIGKEEEKTAKTKRRPRRSRNVILSFLKKKLLHVLATIFLSVIITMIMYNYIDSRFAFIEINYKINQMEKSIDKINSGQEELKDKINILTITFGKYQFDLTKK